MIASGTFVEPEIMLNVPVIGLMIFNSDSSRHLLRHKMIIMVHIPAHLYHRPCNT